MQLSDECQSYQFQLCSSTIHLKFYYLCHINPDNWDSVIDTNNFDWVGPAALRMGPPEERESFQLEQVALRKILCDDPSFWLLPADCILL